MAEEFGLERKESSTLGEKGGVVESREGSRGLTTVEGGEKGPIYSEEFGPVPLPTWIVFRVDLPPPSSLPRKRPRELPFWVFSRVRESLNPTTGCCDAEMMGAPLSCLGYACRQHPQA